MSARRLREAGKAVLDQAELVLDRQRHKRSSLDSRLVEMAMFNKLNRDFLPSDPALVNDVGRIWKTLLPARPAIQNSDPEADVDDDERMVESEAEADSDMVLDEDNSV